MADPGGGQDPLAEGSKDTPSADIDALLQSAMDLDVAATFGLYDDPSCASSLGAGALDTTGMQDDSGSLFLSTLIPGLLEPQTRSETPSTSIVPSSTTAMLPPSTTNTLASSTTFAPAPSTAVTFAPSTIASSTAMEVDVSREMPQTMLELSAAINAGTVGAKLQAMETDIADSMLTSSLGLSEAVAVTSAGGPAVSDGSELLVPLSSTKSLSSTPADAGLSISQLSTSSLSLLATSQAAVVAPTSFSAAPPISSAAPPLSLAAVVAPPSSSAAKVAPSTSSTSSEQGPTPVAVASASSVTATALPSTPHTVTAVTAPSTILTSVSPSTSGLPKSIPTTGVAPSTSLLPKSIPTTGVAPSTSGLPKSIPTTGVVPSTSVLPKSIATTGVVPSTSVLPKSIATTGGAPSTSVLPNPRPATPTSCGMPIATVPSIPSSSAPPPSTSSSEATLKGLNLPLLQFLQVNFPGLQLDNFKDVFQVNALLAHALQQQQQLQKLKQTSQQLQKQQQSRKQQKPAPQQLLAQQIKQLQAKKAAGGVSTSATIAKSTSSAGVPSSAGVVSSGTRVVGAKVGTPAIKSPAVKPGGGNLVSISSGGVSGTSLRVVGAKKGATDVGKGLTAEVLKLSGLTPAPLGVNLAGGGSVNMTSSGGDKGSYINNLATKLSNANVVKATPETASSSVLSQSVGVGSPGQAVTVSVADSTKLTPAGGASPGKPASGAAEQQQVSDSGGARTPVFAQILANMRKQQNLFSSLDLSGLANPTSSSSSSSVTTPTGASPVPLVLGKQQRVHASLASVPRAPSPLRTSVTKDAGSSSKVSSRTAAKRQSSLMTKTLVEHDDVESMDVDVGQPFQMIELPPHLRDHGYSRYNPEEGEKLAAFIAAAGGSGGRGRGSSRANSSIPPNRMSYAPTVPDSPNTLYKLLKVVPRKNSRRASTSTSSSRTAGVTSAGAIKQRKSITAASKKGRFTPSGGVRSKKIIRGRSGVGSRGSSNPGSRAVSEDLEPDLTPNSTDVSDEDDLEGVPKSGSSRRRSQRVAGQRKRYVDDLNIAFSDEEMHEDVMNPRPLNKKEYRGYGEEEDWEYADQVGGAGLPPRSTKHKTKTVSINPTAGFQYSDIYFEPPAEEANVVDKILLMRTRKTETEEERKKHGAETEEFLVKYKNYSYLHTKWASFDKILTGDKRFDGKVKRYKAKIAAMGVFAYVDDEPFNPEYTVVDRLLDVAVQTEANDEIVTHYLVKWRSLPYEDATWELEEDVDTESIRKFNRLQILPPEEELDFQPRPPPHAFKPLKTAKTFKDGNELRPYQLEGLNWLLFNWYARQNCILADEMGLGKTVQSIALLLEIMKAGIRGPFLVIAPLSTIANWEREFEAWSDCNVIVYHGSAYSRRLIHEYELYYRNPDGSVIPDAFKFNVIITTYEVMLSDDSELQSIQWRVVIIDEAHRLKNRNCKLLEELKTLDMEHRVLLTGTPLQNSVEELFSLLNFLEPSTFPSHVAFLQQFGDLKTEEQVEELKGILKPMMLRRLKEDVEKSLAPKEETIVEVELTVMQKQYYRAILERNFTFLSRGQGTSVPSLLNVMMELRKCCNHPYLIQGAEVQIVKDFQARYPYQHISNALVQASGKMVLIDKLLAKLKESGHKVLIFSQMVRCLDIIEDFLRLKGYLYERIDGNVRGSLRQEAIDRFSKPNSDRFVFLLCTRAGGLGINLTAADTVIIYDSDWNPQNDLQAQARCHRIGQNKSVKIYRLITHNTYERDMFDRASLKLGLDKAVLQSMQHNSSSSNGAPQLSKVEIENLLKKGAYGAIMDEDDDANKFCEEDIDQILERRAHVIQLESEGKGSTFSKASFAADGSSDITVDDPDFWQKWAAKANLDLDQLANKDSLVLDTPRLRRQVRRYGNDNMEEIVDMSEALDDVVDILPSSGKHGWTKLECLKVEKGLLVYGWREWRQILRYGKFKKRKLGLRDVENIARHLLMYCLAHFSGDDRVPPYLMRLLDPSVVTETPALQHEEGFYYDFSPEDYQILCEKDPEYLFQDVSYRKHLKRHSNKILLRVRQLHVIRWSIFVDHMDAIRKGATAKSLKLDLPKPEESPPAPWWNVECDHSLLVGIVKHGYEQFGLMRSDPALCFKALCGEEPAGTKKKKKHLAKKAIAAAKAMATTKSDSEESESGEESEGDEDSGPSAPATPNPKSLRSTRNSAQLKIGGFYVWPSLAEVNTRARRYVSAWLKYQKREESKQVHLIREREKQEKHAEASRKKELKKAELAQKWSKREEQDFARVIGFFGVEFNKTTNKYDWTKFRRLANLNKKSDERLTLYLHDFKQMCWRVLKKKRIRRGVSGMRVEPVNEEKASRCLQRIALLSTIREEILPHPDFDNLLSLCEVSFEVAHWWIPGVHDKDLMKGVAKHGLFRSDQLIYGDPQLRFKETVPPTALFDPTGNQREGAGKKLGASLFSSSHGDSSDSEGQEEGEGEDRKTAPASSAVPLGWPKEKAIVMRLTRIVYAFRNQVWPKPMEGLDLFIPVAKQDTASSSSESSGEEEDSRLNLDESLEPPEPPSPRERRPRRAKAMARFYEEDSVVDVEGGGEGEGGRGATAEVRKFEIERSQGLKLTLKKSLPFGKKRIEQRDAFKLEVRIPLVQLSFPSSSGLKKIPKKRPLPEASVDSSSPPNTPEPKRRKKDTKNSTFKIVNPKEVSFADLTGLERVGVINRNTQEKLPPRQSPMLKNLRLWLEGHPHFNVEADWGPLIIEWGALKPEMYSRILASSPSASAASTSNSNTTTNSNYIETFLEQTSDSQAT